jgi:hypothetical protein
MASSDALVKNNKAMNNSSSNKNPSSMVSLNTWLRISPGDIDDDLVIRGCEGTHDGQEICDSTEETMMEEGVTGAVVVVAAVESRLFSITSARRLRVELRAFEIMTGFKSLVLLLDVRLELGGCMLLADPASNMLFRN